jgi:hypothetical protein
MRVLFVSADSYYDRDASVFNSTKSAENLVFVNYCLAQKIREAGGKIDAYSGIVAEHYDIIIFNDYPHPGSNKEKLLKEAIRKKQSKIVLFLMETPVVRSDYDKIYLDAVLDQFDILYTWNNDLVKKPNGKKIHFTSNISNLNITGVRKQDVVCIAANKLFKHKNECYSYRRKVIEKISASKLSFNLYGKSWDRIKYPSNGYKKVLNKLFSYGPRIDTSHLSWRGPIAEKAQALLSHNFSLVIENAHGYSGYITEKILHSLVYGCIPIYYGAKEANEEFRNSGSIFIDDFNNIREMLEFVESQKEHQIIERQNQISDFIQSKGFQKYDAEHQAMALYSDLRELMS